MKKKPARFFSGVRKELSLAPGDRAAVVRYLAQKLSVGRDLLRIHGGLKLIGWILPWLVHRRYFLFEGSSATTLPRFATLDSLRIRRASPAQIAVLLRARPGYYALGQVRQRLKQGHQCFITWVGREPINIRWAFVGSIYLPYLGRTLVLAPDEFYFDELYTVPRYREQGIDIQSYLFMISWLKKQGFRKHFCLLTSWDMRLQRRYLSLRMKKTGEVRSWNFWNMKHLVLQGGLRDIGGGRISRIRAPD